MTAPRGDAVPSPTSQGDASVPSTPSPLPSSRRSGTGPGTDWLQAGLDERLDGLSRVAPPGEASGELLDALRGATSGGKRFRPRLLAMVHEALGGQRPETVAAVAPAVELLHSAFVAHDDVIDGDDTRRGRPSVPGRFLELGRTAGAGPDARRTYAVAGGLLTGDLALGAAFRAVAGAPGPSSTTQALLDLFERALVVSAVGELADVRPALDAREPSLEEVLALAQHKTATYSFVLPMQAGALVADAPAAVVDGVAEVGRLLGVSFQLADDLLGLYGDPSTTGKSNLCDLREGKVTALMVHARSTPAWPLVAPLLGDPDVTTGQGDRVRWLLRAHGSKAFVEGLVADHLSAATRRAADLGLPPRLVAGCMDLCGLSQQVPA